MIGCVLALLHTLLEIVLLRKGPESLPRSPVLFFICLVFWLLALVVVAVTVYEFNFNGLRIDVAASVVGFACYIGVVVLYDQSARLQQMLTAFLGCGAILTLAYVFLTETLGMATGDDQTVAVWLLLGLWLWSVLLDGHILARTIGSHWYFGIAIAVATFFLQFYVGTVLSPVTDVAAT